MSGDYLVHLHRFDGGAGILTGACGASFATTGKPTFTTGAFADDINCPRCLPLVQAARDASRAAGSVPQ